MKASFQILSTSPFILTSCTVYCRKSNTAHKRESGVIQRSPAHHIPLCVASHFCRVYLLSESEYRLRRMSFPHCAGRTIIPSAFLFAIELLYVIFPTWHSIERFSVFFLSSTSVLRGGKWEGVEEIKLFAEQFFITFGALCNISIEE
jgi:hypothetical protein